MEKDGKGETGRVRLIVVNIIRVMLVLAFISSLYTGRRLIAIMAAAGFMLTVLPGFIENQFNIKVPAKYDLIIILFIYGSLFIAEVRGFFPFAWWDIFLNFIAAIALGLVGLAVLFVLYKDKILNASPQMIAFLTFCFAVAIGSVWEIAEFSLDYWFGFQMQKSAQDTMKDLIVNGLGALAVSLFGYYHIKSGKESLISSFVKNVVIRNPKVFGSGIIEAPAKEIEELIRKGEHDKLEFKASLRTNLFTKQIDKRVEHSVLKTVTAYLNSSGGTLLVGIGNNGEIIGLDNEFPSRDKLGLHFTHLVRQHIGNEFLPFINFKLIDIDGKAVMKVDCRKSDKHVFLKHSGEEEFFVRNGPASERISGSTLVDYIRNNFYKSGF